MEEIYIRIDKVNDLYTLVDIAKGVTGDVLGKRGSLVIDVKSILGVVALNPSNGMTVTYPADAAGFHDYIQQFKV